MAVPIIPIIMAVAGLASGVAKGIGNMKNAKDEAKLAKKAAEQEINERARQAAKLMSQQKNSFLKGGVYFDGTPEAVINETYDYMQKDIGTMQQNANTKIKNLINGGRVGFATSILDGITGGAMGFFNAGGSFGGSSNNTNL